MKSTCAVLGCPIVGKSFAVRLTLAYDFDILSRLPNIGWEIVVFWNKFANQVGQVCPSCGTIIRPRKRMSMEHWEKVKRTPIKTWKKQVRAASEFKMHRFFHVTLFVRFLGAKMADYTELIQPVLYCLYCTGLNRLAPQS